MGGVAFGLGPVADGGGADLDGVDEVFFWDALDAERFAVEVVGDGFRGRIVDGGDVEPIYR